MSPCFDTSNHTSVDNYSQQQFQKNNYTSIPNEIFGIGLSVYDISLYNHLKCIHDKHKKVYESVEDLSILCKMSETRVRQSIKVLKEKNFIDIRRDIRFFPDEVIDILKRKKPQKVDHIRGTTHICEWCKGETYAIHEHHHPIKKCEGGTETIKICASCHCEFHHLCEGKNLITILDISGGV